MAEGQKLPPRKLQEQWDKEIPNASLHRLLRVNAPEWWLITVGVVAAMINGSVFPVYSILFGEVLKVFQESRTDQIIDGITIWAVLFLVLALSSAIAIFFKVCLSRSQASVSHSDVHIYQLSLY